MTAGDRVVIQIPKSNLNGVTGVVLQPQAIVGMLDVAEVQIDARWLSGGARGVRRAYWVETRFLRAIELEGPDVGTHSTP